MKGYSGSLINMVLVGLTLLVGYMLSPESVYKMELHLPLNYIIFFSVLILFERQANLNILSVEFQKINPGQKAIWEWFQQSWYFGILMLMAVIWRTYFRIVLIIFPLLGQLYQIFNLSYQSVSWPLKLPYWIIFGWIGFREFRLIADILAPPDYYVPLIVEWVSRAIQVMLTTLFLANLTVMMHGYIDISKGIFSGIIQSLPFMLIVFTFFYIPVRFVEMVSDFIDLQSKWQTIIFWLSTYFLMLTVIKPGITEQIIRFDY